MPNPRDLFQAFRATRHFGSLDGLRCLAILPVIWHHSTPYPLPGLLGKGPFGVDLFFAISGFLITTLLVREQERYGQLDLRQFYLRRCLRIFPIHYAVLAVYVLFMLVLFPAGPQRTHFFASLPYYATYTSNWFVDFAVPHPVTFAFAWSLATEEQFYAAWPGLLRLVGTRWLAAIAMLLTLGADLGAEYGILCPILPAGSLGLHIVTSIAAPICLGSLLAIVAHHARGYAILVWLLGWRGSSTILLVILGYLLCHDGTANATVHVVLACLVVSTCLREDHYLAPLLRFPPVAHVGKVSYGMYLLHVAVIGAMKGLLPPERQMVPLFLVATAVTVGAASLSHRWFELPFLQMKERLGPRERPSQRFSAGLSCRSP